MPVDKLGQAYGVGDLIAVAMTNAGAHNEANMVFAVVEEIITHDGDGKLLVSGDPEDGRDDWGRPLKPFPIFIIAARPYAEGNRTYGKLGPAARKRQYVRCDNILALPGYTPDDIRPHATP